tara:strand:+ start:1898 stop:3622 length:1725 start_codon:yes stop_codon:yes gene_type:complete
MKNKNTFEKSLFLIQNKNQLYTLFFFSLIGVFVELLSIAAVIPAVVFLIEENPLEKFQFLNNMFIYFSISSKEQIISYSLFLIVIVYFLRFLFLIFLNYYKNLFSYNLNVNLKSELVDKYLSQNYSYFFNQNSSKFTKNIIVEVSRFSGNVVGSLFHILIDLFVITTVLISLIFYQPLITMIIALFLILIGFMLNGFSKNMIAGWGKERFNLDETFMKLILETFNSIREIKIFGAKKNFVNNFKKTFKPLGFLNVKQQTYYIFIRQTYEMITLFAFCVLVFYLSNKNFTNEQILTIIGVFAISAFRLLPLFNRLLLAIQDLKFYLPSINHLHDELTNLNKLNNLKKNFNKNKKFENSFELKNINYSYDKDKPIIENLNFYLNKNDKIGIFGKSGSGKSTLVDLIFGLLSPASGNIYVDSHKIDEENDIFEYKLGYISQNCYLLDDTVKRNIAFGLKDEEIDENRVLEIIKIAQLDSWLNETKYGLNTIIGENGKKISGGERQRLGIARTLYFESDIIVLDEPTSSLDEATTKKFLNVLNSLKNKTLIIISHQKDTLSICNRIFEMKNGCLNEQN